MNRRTVLTSGRFGLFADCLVVGVLAALSVVPVLTAYPGLVTATALLRERAASDAPVGPRRFVTVLRQVVASGRAVLVLPPAVAALLAADAIALAAGAPGRTGLTAVLLACVAGALLLGLRAAAVWAPGRRWAEVLRSAAAQALADPWGDALLLMAALLAAGVVLTVPITGLFLLGPLALAAAAVQTRKHS
jgi:hypothetical protein